MPHTIAVLPVKSFGRAKQRLAADERATLGASERASLAEAMVGDVLGALARVPGLDGLLVVTAEPRAAAAAEEAGAAAYVVMASTHERALEVVPLDVLARHAVDVPADPGALG